MKKSFKILAVGTLFLSTAFIQVNAQETAKKAPSKIEYQKLTTEQKADKFVEKFSKDLNLTEQQKSQIKAIKVKEMNELKAAQEKHMEIKKQSKQEVGKILTPEQSKKLEEIRTERKEQFKNHSGKDGRSHHYKKGPKK